MINLLLTPEVLAFLTIGIIIFISLFLSSLRREKKLKLQEIVNAQTGKTIDKSNLKIDSIAQKDKNISWFEKKSRELEQTRTGITFPAYIGIMLVSIFGVYVIVYKIILLHSVALVLSLFGYFVPNSIVKKRATKKTEMFNEQLIKALRRMSSVLKAGGTIKQALTDVSHSNTMPLVIREEFTIVLTDVSFGYSIEEALFKLYERTGSKDVKQLAIAVEIQRQLGGSLAKIIDCLAEAISSKKVSESENTAILASVNANANILTMLPFVTMLGMKLVRPDYFDPLYKTLGGRFLILGCICLVLLGNVVIKKLGHIKM